MPNILQFALQFNTSQAQQALASFTSQLTGMVRNATGAGNSNPLGGITAGAGKAQSSITSLGGAFLNLRTLATGAAAAFAKASVDAATEAEAAFKGLESVANRTGVGIEKAWAVVQDMTADGVMSQTQAATALKNLFARGFGIEESITLMKAFKDASAFGRQAGLEWGEAIVTATEGLKNENSALVDNAGVTKNVAKMWEDYAKELGVTAESLTLAQKRQAELTGVQKESKNSTGDAKKALEGNQGATARLSKAYGDLKTAIGSELTPAFQLLTRAGADAIENVLQPMVSLGGAIVKTFTSVVGLIYDVIDAFKKADTFSQFDKNLREKTTEQSKSIALSLRKAGHAMGFMDAPNMPTPPGKNGSAIPDASTNTTGIRVVAPLTGPTESTRNVKDNINAAQVAKDKAEAAKKEAEELAKQEYGKQEKALARAKETAAQELSIYKAGLDSQQGALDLMLSKGDISRQAHAQRSAKLETEALAKEEATRLKMVTALEAQLENAKKTGDKEKMAEAQQALDAEVRQGAENAAKLATLRSKASKEALEAYRADADEKRKIDETLLTARLGAEKKTNDAIRERELADVQGQYDEKLISEQEYIRKSTAIKMKALDEEAAAVRAQQDLLAKQKPNNKAQAAEDAAKGQDLAAQAKAVEDKRVQLNAEANSKIRMSDQQLTQLRMDLDQQLLEAEGKTFEAKSAAIDAWLAQKKAELAAFPELLAKAEKIAAAQKNQNKFDQAQQDIGTTNGDYQRMQDELQRRSAQGLITDIDLDRQSLELKRKQAAALRERLELLRANSNGSTANVAAIKEVEDELANLDAATSATAKSLNDNFFSAVEKGFQDMFSGAKKPLEALRDVAISVLKEIASMALKYSLQQAFAGSMGGWGLGGAVMSLFGGFRATGGDALSSKAYVVGEKGPELFFPGANGRVVSNAQIQSSLLGTMSRSMAAPGGALGGSRELAPTGGNTHVSVAPKVVVSAQDVLSAMQELPDTEHWVVGVVQRHGRKIQGAW